MTLTIKSGSLFVLRKPCTIELHPSPASSAIWADWEQAPSQHVCWKYKEEPEGQGVQYVCEEVITHEI